MFFLFDASPYTLIIYKKGGSEAPFYRILSSERTNASSLRIPWMARQLRMMLSIGKTAANLLAICTPLYLSHTLLTRISRGSNGSSRQTRRMLPHSQLAEWC